MDDDKVDLRPLRELDEVAVLEEYLDRADLGPGGRDPLTKIGQAADRAEEALNSDEYADRQYLLEDLIREIQNALGRARPEEE